MITIWEVSARTQDGRKETLFPAQAKSKDISP